MNILIALPSEVVFDQLQPLVARTEVEISRVFDGPPALTMAVGSRFDLLVVGDPLSNIEFVDFLRRVRSPESACCRAPMLILTQGDPSAGVAEFLDESTRRCPIDAPPEEIESQLRELIGVAMRAKARLAVELSARLENESLQLYCQTVNVSEGGMLIRSRRPLPLGTEVQLTLSLPGQAESVRALGVVLRHTTAGIDPVEGLAIRFVEFVGDGRARLAEFVAQHEHTFLGEGTE